MASSVDSDDVIFFNMSKLILSIAVRGVMSVYTCVRIQKVYIFLKKNILFTKK